MNIIKTTTERAKKIGISFLIVVLVASSTFFSAGVYEARAEGLAANAAGTVAKCLASFGATSVASGFASFLVVPTNDALVTGITGSDNFKSCMLDGIANGWKREVMRSLVRDTIDWINNGFNGKPSYGANLGKMFEDTKAQILDDIIYGDDNLQGLCTGFELPIKFALQLKFFPKKGSARYEPRCTIDDIERNIDNAVGDVENFYSWNKFLSVTTNPDNNAFGSYFSISQDAQRAIDKANAALDKDYTVNGGFFSFRKCSDEYIKRRKKIGKAPAYDATDPKAAAACPVTTPGRTLSYQFNKTLGAEQDELVTADEFDEIIGAVINQLVSKLLKGSGGARGISGKNYYSEGYTDPALDTYKKELASDYNTAAYDIAIKIAESRKKTAENASAQYEKANSCWLEKENILETGAQRFAVAAGVFGKDYESLTKGTTRGALIRLQAVSSKFDEAIQDAQKDIQSLKENKVKAGGIQGAIANTKKFSELLAIATKAGVEKADIGGLLQKRDISDKNFDEMVNGKIITYDSKGEVRKGGIATSFNYCSKFVIEKEPFSNDGEDLIIANSGKVEDIQGKVKVVVIDGYSPEADIESLKSGLDGNVKNSSASLAKKDTPSSNPLDNRLILAGWSWNNGTKCMLMPAPADQTRVIKLVDYLIATPDERKFWEIQSATTTEPNSSLNIRIYEKKELGVVTGRTFVQKGIIDFVLINTKTKETMSGKIAMLGSSAIQGMDNCQQKTTQQIVSKNIACKAVDGVLSNSKSTQNLSFRTTDGSCISVGSATCTNGNFSYVTFGGTGAPSSEFWINSKTCGV